MKCDHCHTNEATVHMTNIVNNQKTEQHLCSSCANKLQKDGKLSPFSSFVNDIWDNDFFSNDFFQKYGVPRPYVAITADETLSKLWKYI